VWWIREPLDVVAMRDAAGAFVGMKNFEAFTADDPEEKSTRVLVDRVEIAEAGALLLIRIQGSHFLWRMVRRMVGVLAACGRGELSPADAASFLDEGAEPSAAPAALAAPAAGLFLEAVMYEGDPPPGPVQALMQINH
jgi:tRNA pseudouridine38-40 synthase